MTLESFTRRAVAALFTMALLSGALASPTITITAPQDEQTLHDNRGQVTVSVKVGGTGNVPEDHAFQPVLDDKVLHPLQKTGTFTLTGINRGAHTLQVRLLGRGGDVLASSQTIRFHMWQASRLFPARH